MLLLPVDDRVVVKRQTFHVPAPLPGFPAFHHGFGPIDKARFAAAGSNSDPPHSLIAGLCGIEVPDKTGIHLQLAQIEVRSHIAAAIPALVTDAKKRDLVWSRMPVGRALLYKIGLLLTRHVFDPISSFVDSSRT